MRLPAGELKSILGSGLLAFPVTFFDADRSFAEKPYRESIALNVANGAAALFAPGGTGEFFSLSFAEVRSVVTAAAGEARGRVPVLSGAGYGIRQAIELAKAAEESGADGILLFPPYLLNSERQGLTEYVVEVCRATPLGVVVYNRDNAIYSGAAMAELVDRCPNLVGFKDGHGDVEQLVAVRAAVGDRLTFIGGMPTAEIFAVAYQALGFATYSSAIFNFIPEVAVAFYKAVRNGDRAFTDRVTRDFLVPYLGIRNRRRGYAVSIVKAGMRIMGKTPGPVRPPLADLSEAETDELRELIGRVSPLPALKRQAVRA